MISGQDYSAVGQAYVNFPKAVENGQEWFYLKSSEGRLSTTGRDHIIDKKYQTFRAGAVDVKKPHAPYHFLTKGEAAESQADWWIKCAPEPTPLPPVLDAEDHYAEEADLSVTPDKWRIHVHNCLLRAEVNFGRRPVIYTSTGWWNEHIAAVVDWIKDYKFIIAGYLFYKQPIPKDFKIYWPGPRRLPVGVTPDQVVAWQWAGDIPNAASSVYPWAAGSQDFNIGDEVAIYALANQKVPLTRDQQFDLMWADYLYRHPEASL